MLLFAIGVSLFRNVAGFQDSRIGIFVIAICSFIIGWSGSPVIALTGLLAAVVIYWGLRFEVKGNVGTALLSCGAISYSLYLVHVPIGGRVVNLGRRVVDGPLQEFFLSLFALAITIGFAAIFYLIVEKPFVRQSRRLSESRTPCRASEQVV